MWEIHVKCMQGHEQVLHLSGEAYTEPMVRTFCGLLDGTSVFYVSNPREDANSCIGRCGVCRALIVATFTELVR